MELSFEQINNRYDSLPEKLKEAIFSPSIDIAIIRLGQSYRLDNQKIYAIARNIGEVLFGFESYKNLASDLQADLNIDNRLATAIANDIMSKILSPYRKELDMAYSPIIPTPTTKPQEIKPSPSIVDLRPKKEEIKIPTPTPLPEKQEIPKTPSEGPAILSKPKTIMPSTPITTERKKPTLGGLFSFSRRKEATPKEKIVAEIEIPSQKPTAKPNIAKTEAPTFKVVHYSQFEPFKIATTDKENPKIIFGQKPPMPTVPVPPAPSTFQPKPQNTPAKIEPPPQKTPVVPTKTTLPMAAESSPLTFPLEENKKISSPASSIKEIKVSSPSTLTSKNGEEKEMIDLETLQKVKIKVEEEKKSKANNGNVINLRDSI